MAKLGYMPAAALVRGALPAVAAWRAPSVQDLGNVLWAATVLDILVRLVGRLHMLWSSVVLGMLAKAVLHQRVPEAAASVPTCPRAGSHLRRPPPPRAQTPEVMQLLAGKLLALPREAFTQEAYIQLYQAKMSLQSTQVLAHGCP